MLSRMQARIFGILLSASISVYYWLELCTAQTSTPHNQVVKKYTMNITVPTSFFVENVSPDKLQFLIEEVFRSVLEEAQNQERSSNHRRRRREAVNGVPQQNLDGLPALGLKPYRMKVIISLHSSSDDFVY